MEYRLRFRSIAPSVRFGDSVARTVARRSLVTLNHRRSVNPACFTFENPVFRECFSRARRVGVIGCTKARSRSIGNRSIPVDAHGDQFAGTTGSQGRGATGRPIVVIGPVSFRNRVIRLVHFRVRTFGTSGRFGERTRRARRATDAGTTCRAESRRPDLFP